MSLALVRPVRPRRGVTWAARVHVAARWARLRSAHDAGMSTAEYAVGTLAACTFAAVLIAVVKSGAISSALSKLITSALGIGS